jgi:hypothetical protein
VINEAFKSLVPGGYFELQDSLFPFQYIGEPPVHSELYRWGELCVEGSTKVGRPWTNSIHYKRWMEEVGFEDIVEKSFYWPTSTWAKGRYYKELAAFFQADLLNGLEGASLKIIGQLGWTPEEIRAFIVGVKKDVQDTSITCYAPMCVFLYLMKSQLLITDLERLFVERNHY